MFALKATSSHSEEKSKNVLEMFPNLTNICQPKLEFFPGFQLIIKLLL